MGHQYPRDPCKKWAYHQFFQIQLHDPMLERPFQADSKKNTNRVWKCTKKAIEVNKGPEVYIYVYDEWFPVLCSLPCGEVRVCAFFGYIFFLQIIYIGIVFENLYLSSIKYTHKHTENSIFHIKLLKHHGKVFLIWTWFLFQIQGKDSFMSNKCGTSCSRVLGNVHQWVNRFSLRNFHNHTELYMMWNS